MGDKKLKLLYLAKYLEEETDQEHPAGMPELSGLSDRQRDLRRAQKRL